MTRKRSFIQKPQRTRSAPAAAAQPVDQRPSLIERAFSDEVNALALEDQKIRPSDGVLEVAAKYVQLRMKAAKQAEAADAINAEMKHLEEWLIEQMAGAAQNIRVTTDVEGQPTQMTVYLIDDTKVFKGAGVSSGELIHTLQRVGWGDLVSDTYAAGALKAAVRELRKRKRDGLLKDQLRWQCPECEEYFDQGGHCPRHESQHPPELIEIGDDGLPKLLTEQLAIEDFKKLGVRRV